MPSILNTPTNHIPNHFFCLPIAQQEVLLVNVLTDLVLYEVIITSPRYREDPIFQQAIVLFRNYTLLQQLFAQLAVPHLPIQITEAFDPALAAARTSILVLLVDRGLDRLLGALPRDHLALILRTVILSLSEGQRQAYYRPNDAVEGTVQEEEEDHGSPLPLAEPHSPRPIRASSPTNSILLRFLFTSLLRPPLVAPHWTSKDSSTYHRPCLILAPDPLPVLLSPSPS